MKLLGIITSISGVKLAQQESDSYELAMVQALKDAGESIEYINSKVREYRTKEELYKAIGA